MLNRNYCHLKVIFILARALGSKIADLTFYKELYQPLDFAIHISTTIHFPLKIKRTVTFTDEADYKIVVEFPIFFLWTVDTVFHELGFNVLIYSMSCRVIRILDQNSCPLCQTCPQKCTCEVINDCAVESQILCSLSSVDLDMKCCQV